jgi:hypothetical protein
MRLPALSTKWVSFEFEADFKMQYEMYKFSGAVTESRNDSEKVAWQEAIGFEIQPKR